MHISFQNIEVGKSYSRKELAKLWGYKSIFPLSRGVVTPKDDNKIILFVTYQKPEHMEQYKDVLLNEILHWEGPNDHFAEKRMTHMQANGDEIHLFDRKKPQDDFTYKGKFIVIDHTIHANRPSQFTLRKA